MNGILPVKIGFGYGLSSECANIQHMYINLGTAIERCLLAATTSCLLPKALERHSHF